MSRSSLLAHVRELVRLALPTIVMRSGSLVMLMVDVVMLGHFSSRELAYYSLAQGPLSTLMLASIGLLMGTLVLTAQRFGAGEDGLCGAVWRRSVPYALFLGAIVALLAATGPRPYLWLGQEPEIASGAATTALALGVGMPAYLAYLVSAYFLEGLKRPWPGTWIMLAANVLNAGLNALWIPEHGAAGAAWATTAARGAMCVAAAAWVWFLRDRDRFGIRTPAPDDRDGWRLQRRYGYGAGASIGVEGFAFSALNVMSGWFGAESLAAYAIGINLLAVVFMIALGVGAASSVRVGHAHGRGDPHETEAAGWIGLGFNTLLELPVAAAFLLWPGVLAAMYSDDPAVLGLAAALLVWIGLSLPLDGAQAVLSNALRGRGETWMPMVLQSAAYLVVMLPCAWLFSVRFGHGAVGLFEAVAVGSVVSASLLSARFRLLALRDPRRAATV